MIIVCICLGIVVFLPLIVTFIKSKIKKETWSFAIPIKDSIIYGVFPAVVLAIIVITVNITNDINTRSIRDTNYTILKSNEICATTPTNNFYIDYDGYLYSGGEIYITASFNGADEKDEKILFCVLKDSTGVLIKDFGAEQSEDFVSTWSSKIPNDILPGTYYIYVCGDKDIGRQKIEIE